MKPPAILAVIPARRGSKRLPGKNTAPFLGAPLVSRTLDAAAGCESLTHRVVTTDDPAVEALATAHALFEVVHRPVGLANDSARNIDVIRDLLADASRRFDWVVLLQPSSPLRTSVDIDATIDRCLSSGSSACVSVVEITKSSYWLFTPRDERLWPVVERDADVDIREPGPRVYVPNGAVLMISVDAVLAGRDFYSTPPAYSVMPFERSVDIDDASDLMLAEAVGRMRT